MNKNEQLEYLKRAGWKVGSPSKKTYVSIQTSRPANKPKQMESLLAMLELKTKDSKGNQMTKEQSAEELAQRVQKILAEKGIIIKD